ncbi:hypothetical protein SprV_1002905400 [Sparganum proliferum]
MRRIPFTSEPSSVKGLDDVLQELRDANANVTAAVRAAARNRRYQDFASSSSASQSPPSWNSPTDDLVEANETRELVTGFTSLDHYIPPSLISRPLKTDTS